MKFEYLAEYMLLVGNESFDVSICKESNNTFRATCFWSNDSNDKIQFLTEHRISTESAEDALDQIREWAEVKFGSSEIVGKRQF